MRARTVDVAVIEQSSQEHAAIADAVPTNATGIVTIAELPLLAATLARYSPPDIYLLNSAFLI